MVFRDSLPYCGYLWLLALGTSVYHWLEYRDSDRFAPELAPLWFVHVEKGPSRCLTNGINHWPGRGLDFFSAPFRIAQ